MNSPRSYRIGFSYAESLVDMIYTAPQYSGVTLKAAIVEACKQQRDNE
jgi:hypothetical protein